MRARDSLHALAGVAELRRSAYPLAAFELDLLASMEVGPLEAIRRHLDNTDDPTLLILRAHLLVEERLRDILARISRSPDELRVARLSFHQILCLCRAVVGRHDEPAWGFVARLNEVRNRMAHHLEPGDLDELLGSIVERLRHDYADRLGTPVDRFRAAAVFTCGYFDAIKGSIRLRQAYTSEDEV